MFFLYEIKAKEEETSTFTSNPRPQNGDELNKCNILINGVYMDLKNVHPIEYNRVSR